MQIRNYIDNDFPVLEELLKTVGIYRKESDHLGVHPDYRKQRIGSKLMDEAETRLKARGTNTIKLYAMEGDMKLLEFYKKKGWHDLHYVTRLEKQL